MGAILKHWKHRLNENKTLNPNNVIMKQCEIKLSKASKKQKKPTQMRYIGTLYPFSANGQPVKANGKRN